MKFVFTYIDLNFYSVTSEKSFEWDSILKSYWIKSKDNLYIVQCSGKNKKLDTNTICVHILSTIK